MEFYKFFEKVRFLSAFNCCQNVSLDKQNSLKFFYRIGAVTK